MTSLQNARAQLKTRALASDLSNTRRERLAELFPWTGSTSAALLKEVYVAIDAPCPRLVDDIEQRLPLNLEVLFVIDASVYGE